jgi:hypothetical protein
MQQPYQPIYKRVRDLEYRIQDILDKPTHPLAVKLRTEAKRLEDEFEMDKKPRSLEDRIKSIIHILEEMEHNGEHIMDIEHAQELHHAYEHMQMDMRRLPNY